MTDFEKLVAALSRQNVEFIIVGGLAATAHGSARLTQDVDGSWSSLGMPAGASIFPR